MLTQRYYSRMTLDVSHDFTGSTCLSRSLSARLIIYRVTDHVLPQRGCRDSITWYSRDRIRFVRNKRNCATHETVISISYVTGFVSFRLSELRQLSCPPSRRPMSIPLIPVTFTPRSLVPQDRSGHRALAFSDPTSKLAISLLYCLLFAPCILKRCHAGETGKSGEGRGGASWAAARREGRGCAEKRTRGLIVIKVKRKRERSQVWRVG